MTRITEALRGAMQTYAGRALCRSCGSTVNYSGLLDGSPVMCRACGACVLLIDGSQSGPVVLEITSGRTRRRASAAETVPPEVMLRQAARLAVWRALVDDAAAPPPAALIAAAELPKDAVPLLREHARRHAAHLAAAAYPYWSSEDRAAVIAAAGPMSAPMAALRSGPRPAWCYQEAGCGHLLDAWSPALAEDPHGCRICGVLAGGRR